MSIQQITEILIKSGIEPNEASVEVKMLIEHFCNYNAKDIILGNPLDYKKLEIVKQKAELRAKTKQPIQYIIGEAFFMNDYYLVNKNVLIPRDETEIVVNHALRIIKEKGLKTIVDIGTGSGCIACAISKYSDTNVFASDISQNAINIAQKNAKKLNQNIKFINSDLFSNIKETYDMIISNPPYIPRNTKVQKELEFEPQNALFTTDTDGCEYYKKIIEQGKNHLNSGGYVVFELGINQSEMVEKYFIENEYSNIKTETDLAGITRVISARYQK